MCAASRPSALSRGGALFFAVSELRALSVRKALNDVGVLDAAYTGYGHYMPVSGAGSPRNGRVEVWVQN